MFSWLASEIRALSASDYLVAHLVATGLMIYLLYLSWVAFKRFRFIDATATSKIRSAAQGHVELKGLGEWLPNDTIHSPFSNSRCVWYHCTIDKRKRSGKRTTWTNISDERSGHLFRLVDDTGECIINPDHAHVIPESEVTWYGASTDARHRPPASKAWLRFAIGNYRFRERLIRPATSLYALGWFSTVHSTPGTESIERETDELVKTWKLQPERYLRRFDFDQDGKITQQEWQVVRAAAREQVLARIRGEHRSHNLLSRPGDNRQPFIISATDEEALVARKKIKAYSSAAAAFVLFSSLVLAYAIRVPWPLA